jgi:hypothetical protein
MARPVPTFGTYFPSAGQAHGYDRNATIDGQQEASLLEAEEFGARCSGSLRKDQNSRSLRKHLSSPLQGAVGFPKRIASYWNVTIGPHGPAKNREVEEIVPRQESEGDVGDGHHDHCIEVALMVAHDDRTASLPQFMNSAGPNGRHPARIQHSQGPEPGWNPPQLSRSVEQAEDRRNQEYRNRSEDKGQDADDRTEVLQASHLLLSTHRSQSHTLRRGWLLESNPDAELNSPRIDDRRKTERFAWTSIFAPSKVKRAANITYDIINALKILTV